MARSQRSRTAHLINTATLKALKGRRRLGAGAYRREGPGFLYCITRDGPNGAPIVEVDHDLDRRSLQYAGCAAPGNELNWILKISSTSSANLGRPSVPLCAPGALVPRPIVSGTPSTLLAGEAASNASSAWPSGAFVFYSVRMSLFASPV
ncbi:hypothetical protein DFH09DRAFT_1309008 [Mycena vulgaris]|nr:hypothetical protein DFH09DRAFT_1309008 [Mycena vulgaris]